ncbi:hypothetical protein FOZ76_21575 [Verticiella sediminum]|uniref:Uncharacterized protein n=1 Tax=Verticiella sediminum TaxID=1247510 RepID=A0A556AC00_9BURK|nr:hypothetical protein [Verticiella sediminum]TSH90414.1 hypothetical protein FOZ76_21575 [Verticiella sediminum]
MAYASTHTEIRITDEMERRLGDQMAREGGSGGFTAPLKNFGAGIMHCATAFGAFLDAYANTVDRAGRRASTHRHYI